MARVIRVGGRYVPAADIHRCRTLFLRNAMARDCELLSAPMPTVRYPSVNYDTVKQSFL